MSAVARTEQYLTYFDNHVDTCKGAIGSALAASSAIGSFASGYVSDQCGPQYAIWFPCIFWLVGTVIQTTI